MPNFPCKQENCLYDTSTERWVCRNPKCETCLKTVKDFDLVQELFEMSCPNRTSVVYWNDQSRIEVLTKELTQREVNYFFDVECRRFFINNRWKEECFLTKRYTTYKHA